MCRTCKPQLRGLGFKTVGQISGEAFKKALPKILEKAAEAQSNIYVGSGDTVTKASDYNAGSGSSYGGSTTTNIVPATQTTTQPITPQESDNTTLYVVGGLAVALLAYIAFK